MKKQWNTPVITILGLEKTELGDDPVGEVDDSIVWNGHRYYSYTDAS